MFLFLLLAIGCLGAVMAVEPEGYYDRALKKRRYELRDSLCAIIKKHVMRKYDQLWDDYGKTDADADSNIIDMYNSCPFKFKVHQCKGGFHGNKDNMCVCYNREHSFPKSWFGANEKAPMYTDLFHLYPVSGYVNFDSQRQCAGRSEQAHVCFVQRQQIGALQFSRLHQGGV